MPSLAEKYAKWDKIELSDDEEDVHPNIDRESWFRMKHRSRVEREEHEEKDKQRIKAEMEKASTRIKMLERDLQKAERRKLESVEDDDDDDDDDIDDTEGIKIEIEELQEQNRQRQAKLDEYEKNKKWNVDNMFTVKDERTEVNKEAGTSNYTKSGYAKSTVTGEEAKKQFEQQSAAKKDGARKEEDIDGSKDKDDNDEKKPSASKAKEAGDGPEESKKKAPVVAGPARPTSSASTTKAATTSTTKTKTDPTENDEADDKFVYTYHEFTEKYADLCEEFMALKSFEQSKEFLLKHGDVLLQEHAANYLLLATLEDEMNGLHEGMKQRGKQSQIVTNIAELAKSWNTHPGNVIIPFFQRLEQREFLEGYLAGVKVFLQKIEQRAVIKRQEIDANRRREEAASGGQGQRVEKEGVDLHDIPKEERLGPGGLDPLEVIETLPQVMRDAFESRDVEQLKQALMSLDPKDAEYHMNRCIASGLWNQG